MTFGEMLIWTDRLNQIRNTSEPIKSQRLNNMLNDLVLAHDKEDIHARQMYFTVNEEFGVN